MTKTRAMYILQSFPQLSQTYIRTEIEALATDYDVNVICLNRPDLPYRNHAPFRRIHDPRHIQEAIEDFRPHVLHTHYLNQTTLVGRLSERTGVPFTARAHSFDSIRPDQVPAPFVRESAPFLNQDGCLGILAFPFARPLLERAGIRGDKIHDCFPVIDYARFLDRSPNGEGVMNVGACLPKKRMEDFVELAAKLPRLRFNLYPIGHRTGEIKSANERAGNPVNIVPSIEPEDMPAEYKKHRWLVYTACWRRKTVGWPMAVAEAQASGVGVCMPNIRPDLRDYVGQAGYLFDSLDQVIPIISGPVPDEIRESGFEQAKKSDISAHKQTLTKLWDKVGADAPRYAWLDRRPSLLRRARWQFEDLSGLLRATVSAPFHPTEKEPEH